MFSRSLFTNCVRQLQLTVFNDRNLEFPAHSTSSGYNLPEQLLFVYNSPTHSTFSVFLAFHSPSTFPAMTTYKEPSTADHCYAKLIEMFGETVEIELICEIGNSCQWNCECTKFPHMFSIIPRHTLIIHPLVSVSMCVEAILMRSDSLEVRHMAPSSSSSHETPPPPPISYSQRFQMGLNPVTSFSEPPPPIPQPDNNTHLDKLGYQISDGYKILVLMRGLPGSGKSTLARQLIQKTGLNPAQHIISADDFFTDRWGNYNYDRSRISEAHQDCQNRAKAMMMRSFAPIIVDNTNIRLWEMEAFCVNAVDHGYIVQILEPTTGWAKNPEECHRRNTHNVPFDTVLNMRRTYDRIKNGQELLDHFHLPKRIQFQLRERPPIAKTPEPEPEVVKCFSPMQNSEDIVIDSEEIVKPDPFANFNWVAHEREVNDFWKENILPKEVEQARASTATSSKKQLSQQTTTTVDATAELREQMLSALKDDKQHGRREDTISTPSTEATPKPVQKHRKGCPNENEAFADVRLAFPTVSTQYLWDLFEKCQGDANWLMNILLNESADADNIPGGEGDTDFQCHCDSPGTMAESSNAVPGTSTATSSRQPGKPPNQRQKKKAFNQKIFDAEAEEMRRQIEESVRIGDEFYTENMKRVRQYKNKMNVPLSEDSDRSSVVALAEEEEGDDDYDESEGGEDIYEFRLGSEFINQLEGLFNAHSAGLDFHKFRPNVFMKRSLAKQIYHLWVESMMYQLEEQKLDALKDDEEIARQINELDEIKRSSVKFLDVSQMASAMEAYVSNNDWANGGSDLAVKLKRQKLYEIFPKINRATIDDILRQSGDNYERVVDTLNIAYEQNADDRLVEQHNKLILAAKIETEKVPNCNGRSLICYNDNFDFLSDSQATHDDCEQAVIHG